jgi:glycosyltransferase involved in cell wall biosynthesis
MCAAPRISTRSDAEISGPRAHIVGFIEGLQENYIEVDQFIVGDRMPQRIAKNQLEKSLSGNFLKTTLLDIARLGLGYSNARQAWQLFGNNIDVVYERFSPFSTLGKNFKKNGIPWIIETHAPLFYESSVERKTASLNGLARKIEIQAYQECDVIVCVSKALKEIIAELSGVSDEKIYVMPNAVDVRRFNPEEHIPKRLFPGFTVGFVGRLYEWHGLNLLLQAITNLRQQAIDISLVVVGDGNARGELEHLAKELNISENVRFLGQVEWQNVPSLIAGFDVGYVGNIPLKSGKMYHSPLKIYEYMAMGKPIVASAYEDAIKATQNGSLGFLYMPGELSDIQRVLVDAHASKEQLDKLGKDARQEILSQHTWNVRAHELLAYLEAYLDCRK